MGHDGREEEAPTAPFVKAHRGHQASAGYKHEFGAQPEEYNFSDDLDLDVEAENGGEKTVQEQIAELQHMIDACGDTDNLAANLAGYAPQPTMRNAKDPVSQLREQCHVLHKEVTSVVKAKQELEFELRQNVEKLKDRIDDQYREKASLTERLIDAKQKFGGKQQEMLEKQEAIRNKIETERDMKEKMHMEFSINLKALREQLEDLNQQVEKDWEAQVALVKEIDAESDSQSRIQNELKKERDESWQQNRDIMSNFARAGKTVPLPLTCEASDDASQASIGQHMPEAPAQPGSEYQPSIRSIWPLGALRSVTGAPLRSPETNDRDNQELEHFLEKEKLDWEQQKLDITEEQKNLHYQTWQQATEVTNRKVQLDTVQRNRKMLKEKWEKIRERPLAVKSMAPPARTSETTALVLQDCQCGTALAPGAVFCVSCGTAVARPEASLLALSDRHDSLPRAVASWPMASMPRANSEVSESLKLIEDLRQKMSSIEEKRAHLSAKEQVFQRSKDEAQQKLDSYNATLTLLQADVKKSMAQKDSKLQEKKEAAEDVKNLSKIVQDWQKLEVLSKEITEKKTTLEHLQEQNHELKSDLAAQQGCCFKKPAPSPKPKAALSPAPNTIGQRGLGGPQGDPPGVKAYGVSLPHDAPPRIQLPAPSSGASSSAAPPPKSAGEEQAHSDPAQRANGNGAASSSRDAPAPALLLPIRTIGGGQSASSSSSDPAKGVSGDLSGVSENPDMTSASAGREAAGREKKDRWDASKKFFVCRVGEEGWGKSMPASEVLLSEGRPAKSVHEAVEFLKARSINDKDREKQYYLVRDENAINEKVWYCIVKKGKNSIENAQSTMAPYIAGNQAATSSAAPGASASSFEANPVAMSMALPSSGAQPGAPNAAEMAGVAPPPSQGQPGAREKWERPKPTAVTNVTRQDLAQQPREAIALYPDPAEQAREQIAPTVVESGEADKAWI